MNCCANNEAEDGVLTGQDSNLSKWLYKSIPQIYEENLKRKMVSGSKAAVQYGDFQTLTFNQLDIFSTALAKNIRDRVGYGRPIKNPDSDVLVAVCISASDKFVAILFAILKTGAGYLPLDPDYPENLLLSILKTFQPVLLIVDENGAISNKFGPEKFEDICDLLTVESLWFDMELESKVTAKIKGHRKDKEDDLLLNEFVYKHSDPKSLDKPIIIIQTAGFETEPIGVRISQRNIMNRIAWDWRCLKLRTKDVCTLTYPVATIDSTIQVFTALLKGCTLTIFKRADLNNMNIFTEMLASRNVTRISIYNHIFHYFLQAVDSLGRTKTRKALRNLKIVISRGGFLSRPDVVWFFKVFKDGVQLANSNGCAETTGELVYDKFRSLREFDSKLVLGRLSLGRLVDNSRIYTLGTHDQIVDDGSQGEVCCSGHSIALGYVNYASLADKYQLFQHNHQHIKNDTFKTVFHSGEYGRICVEEGSRVRRLYVEGRCDGMVKHKGHMFSLEEVKHVILQLPFVEDAYVLVYHEDCFDQELIAFIMLKPGLSAANTPSEVKIDTMVREILPEFAVPDEFEFVSTIPHTSSGRPAPQQLLSQYERNREPNFAALELSVGNHPNANHDVYLAKKELLGALFKYAGISIALSVNNLEFNFFEIGGTSLNAFTIILHLHRNGYPVTLLEFVSCKTIADIIQTMVTKQNERGRDHEIGPAYYLVDVRDNYVIDILSPKHKHSAVELVARCYANKGFLQQYNLVTYKQFFKFFSENWRIFEDSGISFVIRRRQDKKIVAVALNIDFFTIMDSSKAEGALIHIVEFIHEVKGVCLDVIPKRKHECFENQWMATSKLLSPVDNLKIVTQMESEIIRLAKINFSCIFSTCFNDLSVKLRLDVFNYRLIDIFPINEYKELDTSRPFKLAPDNIAAVACFYHIKSAEPISSLSSMASVVNQSLLDRFLDKSKTAVKQQDKSEQ